MASTLSSSYSYSWMRSLMRWPTIPSLLLEFCIFSTSSIYLLATSSSPASRNICFGIRRLSTSILGFWRSRLGSLWFLKRRVGFYAEWLWGILLFKVAYHCLYSSDLSGMCSFLSMANIMSLSFRGSSFFFLGININIISFPPPQPTISFEYHCQTYSAI